MRSRPIDGVFVCCLLRYDTPWPHHCIALHYIAQEKGRRLRGAHTGTGGTNYRRPTDEWTKGNTEIRKYRMGAKRGKMEILARLKLGAPWAQTPRRNMNPGPGADEMRDVRRRCACPHSYLGLGPGREHLIFSFTMRHGHLNGAKRPMTRGRTPTQERGLRALRCGLAHSQMVLNSIRPLLHSLAKPLSDRTPQPQPDLPARPPSQM